VRAGSVVPAMIYHGVNNTLSVAAVRTIGDVTNTTVNIVRLFVGLAALVLATLYLRSRLPASPEASSRVSEAEKALVPGKDK